MGREERAALATLLDDVAKGYTTKQTECHMLRAYLQRTQPRLAVKAKSEPVVITLSLATCAQAPVITKAPDKKAKAKR